MKKKDMYTLEELYDNLKISLSKLGKMADINEGTLIRIRKGQYSVRRATINKLLGAFSEIYGIDFSLDNVTGITLEDKRARHEQAIEPPIPSPMGKDTSPSVSSPQKRTTRKSRARFETTPLPAGCILATHFAKQHGVSDKTFWDHMLIGRGPGTVPGEEKDPIMGVKDHVEHTEREKPGRPREKERYLTPDQQKAALDFWQRWKVDFNPCDRLECWCKTLKIVGEDS